MADGTVKRPAIAPDLRLLLERMSLRSQLLDNAPVSSADRELAQRGQIPKPHEPAEDGLGAQLTEPGAPVQSLETAPPAAVDVLSEPSPDADEAGAGSTFAHPMTPSLEGSPGNPELR
ncbi:MAG: hypothetical protein KGJ86_14410, partial [Chloroflexota bacterium]|nr:hypothetical protein [Chloroflexota bacterium]